MASNRVHRSFDQGVNWETLSGDLTRGGIPGNVPFGTITSLHESPLRFGQLAVGTDDGLIQVSPRWRVQLDAIDLTGAAGPEKTNGRSG